MGAYQSSYLRPLCLSLYTRDGCFCICVQTTGSPNGLSWEEHALGAWVVNYRAGGRYPLCGGRRLLSASAFALPLGLGGVLITYCWHCGSG